MSLPFGLNRQPRDKSIITIIAQPLSAYDWIVSDSVKMGLVYKIPKMVGSHNVLLLFDKNGCND